MDAIQTVFVQEAREQLAAVEEGALRLEQGERDAETINAIFRAAHTIKGAAGSAELPGIERFTHSLENLFDRLRNGEVAVSADLVGVMLRGCDHIGALLDGVEAGNPEPDAALAAAGAAICEAADRIAAGEAPGEAAADPEVGSEPAAGRCESGPEGRAVANDCWHVSVRFGRDMLKNGMEPHSFLRYLEGQGEIVRLTTILDAIPAAEEMDPETCYLGFELDLRGHTTKEAIEDVFRFCRDECTLFILPPRSSTVSYVTAIQELPEETMRLGEILVRAGTLTAEELEHGLAAQAAQAGRGEAAEPIGEILVQAGVVQPEVVVAAAEKQKQVSERKAHEARFIRVQADKLDQLIDLVGELVIAGASATLLAQRSGHTQLVESTSILGRLVENIRDSALQLRMVQIGETFSRFNRVVRDTARELGKEIELAITGAETELDKSVVEKLGDPLMHLVRNAIDHGIEPAADRVARGKPAAGTVRLNAFHDSGGIVIQVGDDGGGLSRERIHAKAVEKGIIEPGATLGEREVIDLIFAPGFSTVAEVTNLSGRGVGMDVVRRNVQSLRGAIDVATKEGEGTTFTIRLPLTLAIIDGFLVGVARSSYVIPLDMVVECVEMPGGTGGRNYINLRGEVLPVVRLREQFEVEGSRPARENVVVVRCNGAKAGIVVDVLQGECQTVIKPLGAMFRNLRGIAGSTILGTGEVSLILDVQALVSIAAADEGHALEEIMKVA